MASTYQNVLSSKKTRFQIHTLLCHLLWFSTLLIILSTPWMMMCLWKMYHLSYLKANQRRRSCRRHDPMALHSLSSLNISTCEHANRFRRKPMIKPKKKMPPQKQQSQLQHSLNMDSLMDKVLGTPTTVTLRELLGASPVASKKIQDYLRVTRSAQNVQKDSVNFLDMSPLNPQINRPEYNPHDAKLVNLQVKFKNGQTANAL